MAERQIKLGGLYRHFKGGLYRVHHLAIDSEASNQDREETVVVYEGLPDRKFFVRPLTMFLEDVDRDGKMIPRFVEEEEVENHG